MLFVTVTLGFTRAACMKWQHLKEFCTCWADAYQIHTSRQCMCIVHPCATRLTHMPVYNTKHCVYTFTAGYGDFPADGCIPDSVEGAKFVRDLYEKVGDTAGMSPCFALPINWTAHCAMLPILLHACLHAKRELQHLDRQIDTGSVSSTVGHVSVSALVRKVFVCWRKLD